jgi:hypothetical protein
MFARGLLQACLEWYRTASGHDVGTELNKVANAVQAMQAAEEMPCVVCLCGSTRFKDAFEEANREQTLVGKIVLSVGCFDRAASEMRAAGNITDEQKVRLDVLHKRKIDLADEVLVLNQEGYIGDSTRSKVDYALRTGKHVRWYHPDQVPEEYRQAQSVKAGTSD